jgi:hypothetical protein
MSLLSVETLSDSALLYQPHSPSPGALTVSKVCHLEPCPSVSNIAIGKSFVMREEGGRGKGECAIKLILTTLIKRFGSTANHSIKIMTLGPFCHHLGSSSPPLPTISPECWQQPLCWETGRSAG